MSCGQQRSRPGRTTEVPQIHTTHLRGRKRPRPKLGNTLRLWRSRNRHNSGWRDLITAHVQGFSSLGWTLSGLSTFLFYSSILTTDIPTDRNCVRLLQNMAQLTFQRAPLNYAHPSVVSSPGSVNFSKSTNQTSALFPPPPMTMSLTYLCPFRPPSRTLPGLSARQN